MGDMGDFWRDVKAAKKEAGLPNSAPLSALEPANRGHGHVRPRPDGVKARCGGPGLCRVCQREQAGAKAP